MRLRINRWLLGLAAGFAVMALADAAAAQSCGDPVVCPPPEPPPCDQGCQPEPPPPEPEPEPEPCDYGCQPPPPTIADCMNGSCNTNNVNVNVNVKVNAEANAQANALSRARASARSWSSSNAAGLGFGRGGGGSAYVSVDQPYPTTVQGLNVEAPIQQVVRTPFTAWRREMKQVIIRAVCIDDRSVPHPASQVRPGRDVGEDYEGELYRCLAGTWLQATFADWQGEERFDGGESVTCRKHEALWYGAGGKLECRPEKPERDCNERSLLRRYGAGVKVLTMFREEEYTEYREEVVETTAVITSAITLDGGVGGRVF